MILPCSCTHAFQDERHGNGRRVHNPLAKTPGAGRCTVCGTVKDNSKKEGRA